MNGVSATRLCCSVILALSAVTTVAAAADGSSSVNVRPFFSVGYTRPAGLEDFDRGFGMGLGFEIERSRLLTAIFRFDWDELRTPAQRFGSATAINWCVGPRLYLPTPGTPRCYAEALVGERMIGQDAPNHADEAIAARSSDVSVAELAGAVRIGFATARRGMAGFLVDAGYVCSLKHPDLRGGIVPVRFGIIFP